MNQPPDKISHLSPSELNLRHMVDNIIGFVGVLELDGTLVEVNEGALSAAGIQRKDVVGKKFWDCYWWSYDAKVMAELKSAFESAVSGKMVRQDMVVRMRGDTRMVIDFSLSPARDEAGNITLVIPSGIDISERKQVEQKTKQREQALAFLAALQTELTDLDQAQQIVETAARRVTEFLGLYRCTLSSIDPMADTAEFFHDHRPPDQPCLIGTYAMSDFVTDNERAMLVAGRAVAINDTSTGQRSAHQNEQFQSIGIGSIVEAPCIYKQQLRFLLIAIRKQPYEWPEHEVQLLQDLANQVYVRIERTKAEQALQLSEQTLMENQERLMVALAAGGLAAWEWRSDGRVWTERVSELLGLPAGSIQKLENFFEQVAVEDLPKLQAGWKKTVEQGQPFEEEFRITTPDGRTRWIVGTGKAYRDESGTVNRVLGLNWDSTKDREIAAALKEGERKAREANLAKSEFIANISHEIRTPMTAVLGYADILIQAETNPEKLNHLNTIRRNGNFLLDIINDILDLSKIEAGKMETELTRFSPLQLIADIQSMMDVRAKEKQIDFSVEFAGAIPNAILSDPKRLKQILVNLLGNAIKFTQSGGVKLKVHFDSSTRNILQLEVADSGIGMSDEQLARLFKPFSQGDASVSRKFGGTGLGLVISKRLAQTLGGDIMVTSELGVGSVFTCTINVNELEQDSTAGEVAIDATQARRPDSASPLPGEETDTSTIAEKTNANESAIKLGCHVLIVDDRRDIRFLTRHFLVKSHATIAMARNGQEALDLVRTIMSGDSDEDSQESRLPDLILLDMQMPLLDGYETATQLRKLGYDRPIIALTADAMQGDMNRCLESGCDAYLSKPIDGPALIRMVYDYTHRD